VIDFWGVHDAGALAGVRRRADEFLSPLRDLAATVGRLKVWNSMSALIKYVHRL
jgi:hypothetical protein